MKSWKSNKQKVETAKKKRRIRAAKMTARAEALEKELTSLQTGRLVRQKVHQFSHPGDAQ